jgi:hypothetical protein
VLHCPARFHTRTLPDCLPAVTLSSTHTIHLLSHAPVPLCYHCVFLILMITPSALATFIAPVFSFFFLSFEYGLLCIYYIYLPYPTPVDYLIQHHIFLPLIYTHVRHLLVSPRHPDPLAVDIFLGAHLGALHLAPQV